MSVIIRLQNLPWSANASNIRRFFSGMNIPEGGVHIVGGENGDAFIGFTTDDDARRAMLLDGQALNGAAVRLMLSSLAEMQVVIAAARAPQDTNPPASQNPYGQPTSQFSNEFQQPNQQRFPAYQQPEMESNQQDPSRRYSVYEPPSMGQQRPAVRDYQPRSDATNEGYGQPQQDYGQPQRNFNQQQARDFNPPPRDFQPPPRDFNQSSQNYNEAQGQPSNWPSGNFDNENQQFPDQYNAGYPSAHSREPPARESHVEMYMPPRNNDSEERARNPPGVPDAYGYSQPQQPVEEYDYASRQGQRPEPRFGNGYQGGRPDYNDQANVPEQCDDYSHNYGYGGRDQPPRDNRFGDRFNPAQRDSFRPRPFESEANENFGRPQTFQEPQGGGNFPTREDPEGMRGGPPPRNRWGPEITRDKEEPEGMRGGPPQRNRWGPETTHDIPPQQSFPREGNQQSRWGGPPEPVVEEFRQPPQRQPPYQQNSAWSQDRQADPYAPEESAPVRDFSVKPPWLSDDGPADSRGPSNALDHHGGPGFPGQRGSAPGHRGPPGPGQRGPPGPGQRGTSGPPDNRAPFDALEPRGPFMPGQRGPPNDSDSRAIPGQRGGPFDNRDPPILGQQRGFPDQRGSFNTPDNWDSADFQEERNASGFEYRGPPGSGQRGQPSHLGQRGGDYQNPSDEYQYPPGQRGRSGDRFNPVTGSSPQHGMKRPSPGNGAPPPFKAPRTSNPSEDYHQGGGKQQESAPTVIRLKMTPSSVNIKKIFSVLWGVHIVPKWGVRIELDAMNRPTGYVLVKLATFADCEKAVSYTGKKVDGYAVTIEVSNDDIFYSIPDKSRTAMAPPSNVKIGTSLYLKDNCLELTGLVPNINKKELLTFLGISDVPVDCLYIGNFGGGYAANLRGFLKLDSEQKVKTVMQKNNISFQGKCTIKLCSISALQREKYISEAKSEDGVEKKGLKPPPPPILIKHTVNPATKQGTTTPCTSTPIGKSTTTPSTVKPTLIPPVKPTLAPPAKPTPVPSNSSVLPKPEDSRFNCLELTNLPKFANAAEVRSQLDVSTPLDWIKLQQEQNRAFVCFPSEPECRRNLGMNRRPLRGCVVKLRVITRGEMLKLTGQDKQSEDKVKKSPQSNAVPAKAETTTEPSAKVDNCNTGERFSVSVCNLPMHFNVDKVRDFFKGFALIPSSPVVLKMSAQGKPLGEGSVFFKSAIEADRAIRELKGCRLAGREVLLKYQS